MYHGVNRIHDFDIEYLFDYNTKYAYNPLIFTILFGLSESSKIALFKDIFLAIIEAKVTKKCKKSHFP